MMRLRMMIELIKSARVEEIIDVVTWLGRMTPRIKETRSGRVPDSTVYFHPGAQVPHRHMIEYIHPTYLSYRHSYRHTHVTPHSVFYPLSVSFPLSVIGILSSSSSSSTSSSSSSRRRVMIMSSCHHA